MKETAMDSGSPADFVDNYLQNSTPISVTVAPSDGGPTRSGTIQAWVSWTGATYFAWRIDGYSGRLSVLDRSRETLWFGPVGMLDGVWGLELGPVYEDVEYAFWCGCIANQSPSMMARSVSSKRAGPASSVDQAVQPASPSAAAVGDVHAFELDGYGEQTTALMQAWRPHNGGAVYIACEVDRTMLEWSVYSGHAVWFGRTGQLVRCYSAFPAGDSTFDGVETDIDALRSAGPAAGLRVIEGDVQDDTEGTD